MIKQLTIQNYALIENLEMSPSDHLNVITGETGAGKSIMLGALGLLLGKRADTKSLFNADKKCLVEATFDISLYNLKDLFDSFDLDYEQESIVRREISASGKSRAFVNDTPVTLDVLKSLGNRLVDIHSQNETLNLSDSNFQLGVIDQFAGAKEARIAYRKQFKTYQELLTTYNSLKENESQLKKEFEFDMYQLKELEEADLDGEQLETLENELSVLENAEEIKLKLNQSIDLLDGNEYAINQNLSTLLSELKNIQQYGPQYQDLFTRLESCYIELEDIRKEMGNQEENIEVDEEALMVKRDRLDLLQKLLQKHHTSDLQDLITLRDQLRAKTEKVQNLDAEIEAAKSAADQAFSSTMDLADELSILRQGCFDKFSEILVQLLGQVGMPEAQIEVSREEIPPSNTGIDQIAILFTANKGVSPQPLKDVASGGEFSRLMFCIKFIMAEKTSLPTMIFDEIDTGVSGEIALKMIQMMKKMSANHQVISISHLPQFAAGGNAHYFVYKDNSSDRSISKIKELRDEERVESIARMISGDNLTDSAMESARELLAG